MNYLPTVLHMVLGIACMWATLCRLNLMSKGTRHLVSLEYIVWGTIAAALMFVPSRWWVFVVLVLILAKFLVTSKNWSGQQPEASLRRG